MNNKTLSISNTTKSRPPRLPFLDIKNEILGPDYALSIALIGDDESRELNRRYRNKDKPANVLSFPLSDTEGEIVIDPLQVERDAPLFSMEYEPFFAKIVIHGMLHLKGLEHGDTMEQEEERLLQAFSL